jgi:hypothetical protein
MRLDDFQSDDAFSAIQPPLAFRPLSRRARDGSRNTSVGNVPINCTVQSVNATHAGAGCIPRPMTLLRRRLAQRRFLRRDGWELRGYRQNNTGKTKVSHYRRVPAERQAGTLGR